MSQSESGPCGEPNSIINKCVNVGVCEEMVTGGFKRRWLKWAKDHREWTYIGSEKCEFRERQPRCEELVTCGQEVVGGID
jgi:hypothetical protein